MGIKNALKKNKITYYLICSILTLYYNYIRKFFVDIGVWMRKSGLIKNGSYRELRAYKNRYSGEQCFILATGPSLTLQDCEMLKSEYTFGMNSIIDLFEVTDWRPSFYGIQDINVYGKVKDKLYNYGLKDIFVGSEIGKYYKLPKSIIKFHNNFLEHRVMYFHKRFRTKFSNDAFVTVYDGYTITYSLIQIAAYMGFEKIYLVGCDNNYPKEFEQRHFKGCKTAVDDPSSVFSFERCTIAYKMAKNYMDRSGLKIFNATRGGKLEIFDRINLEEAIRKQNE